MAHPSFPVPTDTEGSLRIMPCPASDDLSGALSALKRDGVTHVLSMLPDAEAKALGISEEPSLCAAMDLVFLSHPIPDFHLPDADAFSALVGDTMALLRAGEHLAVHCRAGIGRSGMVAVAVLVTLGETAQNAIERVSIARGVSIPDTDEQKSFLFDFAERLAGTRRGSTQV